MSGNARPSSPDGLFSGRISAERRATSGDPSAAHPFPVSQRAPRGGDERSRPALRETVSAGNRGDGSASGSRAARGSALRREDGDPSSRRPLPDAVEGPGFRPGEGRGARIITVSGSSKDVGKSSLAAFLASRCPGCAAMKVSVHGRRPPGEPIVEEGEVSGRPDTDTARLRAAGARPVLWVRSTPETLGEDVREALSRLEAPAVIVEGNSVLRHLEPDFAVFVMSTAFDDFKPSAFEALARAHTVVVNGLEDIGGERALELERAIKAHNPRAKVVMAAELGRVGAWEVVLSRAAGMLGGDIVSADVEERVLEAVREKAEEGRIPCAVALKLAEELGVPPIEVGKAANTLNIKIVKCSLGCF